MEYTVQISSNHFLVEPYRDFILYFYDILLFHLLHKLICFAELASLLKQTQMIQKTDDNVTAKTQQITPETDPIMSRD